MAKRSKLSKLEEFYIDGHCTSMTAEQIARELGVSVKSVAARFPKNRDGSLASEPEKSPSELPKSPAQQAAEQLALIPVNDRLDYILDNKGGAVGATSQMSSLGDNVAKQTKSPFDDPSRVHKINPNRKCM